MYYETIYEPAEDSFMMEKLLKEKLQQTKNLKITEIGVGSGFVFSELVKTFPKNNFSAIEKRNGVVFKHTLNFNYLVV